LIVKRSEAFSAADRRDLSQMLSALPALSELSHAIMDR
jgi:hypothetical protein